VEFVDPFLFFHLLLVQLKFLVCVRRFLSLMQTRERELERHERDGRQNKAGSGALPQNAAASSCAGNDRLSEDRCCERLTPAVRLQGARLVYLFRCRPDVSVCQCVSVSVCQ
jgi:hypothetical protein